jgi:prephenate dehydrogenase
MDRIAIIGTGLIGTSIGLALRHAKVRNIEIVGHDREPNNASKARKRGAIDKMTWNIADAVEGAKLIIIAVPVQAVRDVMAAVGPIAKEGAIITDTASTKSDILFWAEDVLPRHVHFVGGHPMAGREFPGPDAAETDLFQGAYYCIVPSRRAPREAVQVVADLAQSVGATPYYLDAQEHDGLVAAVSHLPLVVSAALVNTATQNPAWREMGKLASSGFRDVSRLASGDPEMSRDIMLTNQESVIYWLDEMIASLERYKNMVREGGESLETAFTQAKVARDKWLAGEFEPEDEKAVPMPSFNEVVSDFFLGSIGRRVLGQSDEMAKRIEERQRRERDRNG